MSDITLLTPVQIKNVSIKSMSRTVAISWVVKRVSTEEQGVK